MLEESLLYVLAEGAAEQAANLKQSDILIDGVLSDSDRNDLIDQLFNMKVSDFQSLIRLPPIAPIVTPISSPPALPAPPGTSSDPEGGGGGGGRGAGKLASLYVKILKDNLKVGRRTAGDPLSVTRAQKEELTSGSNPDATQEKAMEIGKLLYGDNFQSMIAFFKRNGFIS